jgi:hypothetical protein
VKAGSAKKESNGKEMAAPILSLEIFMESGRWFLLTYSEDLGTIVRLGDLVVGVFTSMYDDVAA